MVHLESPIYSAKTKPIKETIQRSIMVLFRFSKLNSCLVLLYFLFSLHHIPCALSQREPNLCDTLFQCGNLTAGFPFWGEARPEPCGHPSLVLHCNQNNTSLIISGQVYRILQINNSSSTLRLARQDFLGGSFCSATFTGTTLTPELFELLPDYKILFVYYVCNPLFHRPVNFTCPKLGLASVHLDNNYQEYCGVSFNITVPTSYVPGEEALNLTHLGSVLRNGFEVKLKIDERPCQQCQSSGGICTYNVATPVCCNTNSSSELKCTPMIQSGSSRSRSLASKIVPVGGFLGAVMDLVVLIYLYRKRKTPNVLRKQNLKALIPLKQYTYTEVKKITKSLAEVIGKGGFGTVYRGKLRDGRIVAVKILKESKENGEDFINEVASMSKTSHVNIVVLLGFCYEGSKRAIIYEYLENGSLDQFFSSEARSTKDWRTLYEISLGIARGLEYLHNGCQTRIVHFDIKPQNVLLDGNLCPKVADFGLAKLCGKRESILSLLDTRGTIGYIAPEVFSRIYGNVSHKSDVYSYGMLLIEMIGARNRETAQHSESNTSSMYFPEWIYKDLQNENYRKLLGEEITIEEEGIAKKMTLVGLWCIQSSPSNRPPMNRVIEMLEGSVEDLEVPPKPVLHLPATQFAESSWLSEENSGTQSCDSLSLYGGES